MAKGKGKGKQAFHTQKGENPYIAKQKAHDKVIQDATRQTYIQYMTDTLIFTLNDPEVMGKDVFGYARLKKVLDAWGKYFDDFFDALTLAPEADYARQKMDDALRRIIPENETFVPFEKRYDWLPQITYEGKGEQK